MQIVQCKLVDRLIVFFANRIVGELSAAGKLDTWPDRPGPMASRARQGISIPGQIARKLDNWPDMSPSRQSGCFGVGRGTQVDRSRSIGVGPGGQDRSSLCAGSGQERPEVRRGDQIRHQVAPRSDKRQRSYALLVREPSSRRFSKVDRGESSGVRRGAQVDRSWSFVPSRSAKADRSGPIEARLVELARRAGTRMVRIVSWVGIVG